MADVVSETLKQAAENLTENANVKTPATIQGKIQKILSYQFHENNKIIFFSSRYDFSIWIASYYGFVADILRLQKIRAPPEGNQSE